MKKVMELKENLHADTNHKRTHTAHKHGRIIIRVNARYAHAQTERIKEIRARNF